MKGVHAVFFDMDGLLLDTEKIALTTFVEACRECYFEPDLDAYRQCIGTTHARVSEILINGHGKNFPFDEILKRWTAKYDVETQTKPAPLKNGAMSLLRHLDRAGIKRAVVTSTSQERACKKLACAGILKHFQFVLGGDQISKGKPDPEIYLVASHEIGEEPAACLALEDSDNGVRSAIAAGCRVIQIPDLIEPSMEIKAFGHKILYSLAEVERLITGA